MTTIKTASTTFSPMIAKIYSNIVMNRLYNFKPEDIYDFPVAEKRNDDFVTDGDNDYYYTNYVGKNKESKYRHIRAGDLIITYLKSKDVDTKLYNSICNRYSFIDYDDSVFYNALDIFYKTLDKGNKDIYFKQNFYNTLNKKVWNIYIKYITKFSIKSLTILDKSNKDIDFKQTFCKTFNEKVWNYGTEVINRNLFFIFDINVPKYCPLQFLSESYSEKEIKEMLRNDYKIYVKKIFYMNAGILHKREYAQLYENSRFFMSSEKEKHKKLYNDILTSNDMWGTFCLSCDSFNDVYKRVVLVSTNMILDYQKHLNYWIAE